MEEQIPRVPILRVETREAGVAIWKAIAGGGAGKSELQWILNPENFATAEEMLNEGTDFCFPSAAAQWRVPFVTKYGGQFWKHYAPLVRGRWVESARIVVATHSSK
jgi:hypothetical protein